MDLFAKIKGLEIVDILRQSGLYPFFRKLQGSRGNNVVHNDRDLVMMGSNNYLGLTHDPRVIEAAVDAIRKWGSGCTGSRFLNGNLELHEELEKELANFFGTEDALVFASGFMANSGAISALAGPEDYILSDKENHACILEGCMLTKANFMVYRHSDMEHLEKKLKTIPPEAGKLIITDGVFSMTGHLALYDQIYALAKKYNARTYIDDAHGLGVVGVGGRGTASHFGLPTDILMGTFSKSLASQGGFICADAKVIDWLRHKARTFIFSAALAPASAAAALSALRILREEPQRVEQVRVNAAHLKNAFDAIGLNTLGTETCVVPVFIGDDETALYVCQELLKRGVFTTPVVYPAVRKGQAMIRCSVMATHTRTDLDTAIEAFRNLAPIIFKANQNPNMKALADQMHTPTNHGLQYASADSAEVRI
ncbi:MAG: pyridoxal phosphate-dependent aminotransferase family protein [Bdellovibrionia bacterium]